MRFVVYYKKLDGQKSRIGVDAFDKKSAKAQVKEKYPQVKITKVYNTGIVTTRS